MCALENVHHICCLIMLDNKSFPVEKTKVLFSTFRWRGWVIPERIIIGVCQVILPHIWKYFVPYFLFHVLDLINSFGSGLWKNVVDTKKNNKKKITFDTWWCFVYKIQNVDRILPNWSSDAMDKPSIGYLNSWLLPVLILARAKFRWGKIWNFGYHGWSQCPKWLLWTNTGTKQICLCFCHTVKKIKSRLFLPPYLKNILLETVNWASFLFCHPN